MARLVYVPVTDLPGVGQRARACAGHGHGHHAAGHQRQRRVRQPDRAGGRGQVLRRRAAANELHGPKLLHHGADALRQVHVPTCTRHMCIVQQTDCTMLVALLL